MNEYLRKLMLNQLSVESEVLANIVLLAVIIVFAVLVNIVAKLVIVNGFKKIAIKSDARWDDAIIRNNVIGRLVQLLPIILVYYSFHFFYLLNSPVFSILERVLISYAIFVGVLVLDAILNASTDIYRGYIVSQAKPIKSYVQVVKLIIYLIATVLIIAELFNSSPWAFLSGLGAMTAVLMLVFKDSILGFVSSIQISANDMVRIGDWIEMPKYGADGDVIDITLTTVKVQNFDKTISMIPTYALVSDSFKNWRGMDESPGRRIKRSIFIDMNSVSFANQETIESYKKINLIQDYVEKRIEEINLHNQEKKAELGHPVNGRRITNLGTFRAYVREYLRSHPKINQNMTLIVRQLDPSVNGIPIEIYCFSSDKNWVNYEDIQSDIFDHILSIIPAFGLRVFQNPSGGDFRKIAINS